MDGDQSRKEEAQMTKQQMAAWIIGVLGTATIVAVLAISQAAHAEDGWCAEWAEGYAAGFCLHTRQCYIAPKVCPAPADGEIDGYMRGLRDGLNDRRARI